MNLIVILAILLGIPLALRVANRKLFVNRFNNLFISAVAAFLVYIFILVNVVYINHKLSLELAAFDLNGDGLFSGEEITPAQEEVMSRVISDTGRIFAPFTGAVFSFIYFIIVWLILLIGSWLKSHRANRST